MREHAPQAFTEEVALLLTEHHGPAEAIAPLLVRMQGATGPRWLDVHGLWAAQKLSFSPDPLSVRVKRLQLDAPRVADDLVTVVRGRKPLQAIVSSGEAELPVAPLTGDLMAVVALARGDVLQLVLDDELERLGLDMMEAIKRGVTNMADTLTRVDAHGEHPRTLACGGRFEPTLLMLDPLWVQIRNEVRGDLLVAPVALDRLLVAGTKDEAGIQRMEAAWDASAADRLSPQIVRWAEGSWVPWPPHHKRCGECHRTFDRAVLVCDICDRSLADDDYLWVIGVCTAIATLGEGILWASGLRTEALFANVLASAAALVLIGWPALNVAHWMDDPARPVASEMASVFGDRVSRLMVAALGLFIIGFVGTSGATPSDLLGFPDQVGPVAIYETVRRWVNLIGGSVAVVMIMASQGPRFFDARIVNTWSRESTP